MAKTSRQGLGWSWFFWGTAAGWVLGYFTDPDRGRRRRHIARDQAMSFARESADSVQKQYRNILNRAQGWQARLDRINRGPEMISDEVLVERVRSAIGRKTQHPRSVEVESHQGVITLRGPILSSEIQNLFDHVRDVPGVRHVINQMDVHLHDDGVPGLQGPGKAYKQKSSRRLLR